MDNLLLLHGALGSADTLVNLKRELQQDFKVFVLNFTGHGGSAIPSMPLSMDLFAQDILQCLEQNGLEQVHIFGYSMGGYAALYFALHHPERVKSIFTLGTKFEWTKETAEHETRFLVPERIEKKVPEFAKTLLERHSPQDWKVLVRKTAELMHQLGSNPVLTDLNLQTLSTPILIAVGDQDSMVTVSESVWAYSHILNARLLVIPDTKHPLEAVPTHRVCYELQCFINSLNAG